MNSIENVKDDVFYRSYIIGSRRLSNVSWAIIVSLGGLGFFLTGLSKLL